MTISFSFFEHVICPTSFCLLLILFFLYFRHVWCISITLLCRRYVYGVDGLVLLAKWLLMAYLENVPWSCDMLVNSIVILLSAHESSCDSFSFLRYVSLIITVMRSIGSWRSGKSTLRLAWWLVDLFKVSLWIRLTSEMFLHQSLQQ